MIDLYGLIVILAALLTNGPPDRVDWSASAGLSVAYGPGGVSGAVVIGLDPTPVRYRPAAWPWTWDDRTCGLTDGYNVWVAPLAGCTGTLAHELTHVRQRQALGPLEDWALKRAGVDLEAHPRWTASGMLHPYGLEHPLIRITIPVRWETTP